MDEIAPADSRSVAITILKAANQTEQTILARWLDALLLIRGSDLTPTQKAKAAVICTYKSSAVLPMVKLLAVQVRKHGWDKRSSRTRWATVASVCAIATFGGQSAGIAALGGAIGVPLWIVFGGGAAVAKVILDEWKRNQIEAIEPVIRLDLDGSDLTVDAIYEDVTGRVA